MSKTEILESFTQILRELLFDDSVELSESTTRSDVPNWDSFAYVNFIVAVEMRYGIKFGVAEVESFGNVGEIVQRTEELTNE
jgi:acyl carrier protein